MTFYGPFAGCHDHHIFAHFSARNTRHDFELAVAVARCCAHEQPRQATYYVISPKQTDSTSTKLFRCRQDSNLRGARPIDFESIAITTLPRHLLMI